jgi:hypothetical protein
MNTNETKHTLEKTADHQTGKTIIGFAKLNSFRGFETPVWINSEGFLVYRAENGLCDKVGQDIEIQPAALIAAAPELLWVSESIEYACAGADLSNVEDLAVFAINITASQISDLRAAIAKAKGK